MFCGNCGTQNDDKSTFCKECGSVLSGKPEMNLQTVNEPGKSKGKSGKGLLMIVFGIAAVFIILFVAVGAFRNLNAPINLNKYITVKVEGYDGHGTAKIQIDWDALDEEYGEKIEFTGQAKTKYRDMVGMLTPMELLQEAVEISADEVRELSNGDTIKYSIKISEGMMKCLECQVEGNADSYKVSGLDEVEEFNPFEDIEVVFYGVSSNGTVEITGEKVEGLPYLIDKRSGLKNGDIVTVSVSLGNNEDEDYLKRYGKIPAKMSQKYTVSGLDEYVTRFDELEEADVTKLKTEAEDMIYSRVTTGRTTLSDLVYAGHCMREKNDDPEQSRLFLIYTGNVSNSSNESQEKYFVVEFSDLKKGLEDFQYDVEDMKDYEWLRACYRDECEKYENRETYTVEYKGIFEQYTGYEYVCSMSEIDDSYLNELSQLAKEKIMEEFCSQYDKVENLTEIGNYLRVDKDPECTANKNMYGIVFSANITDYGWYSSVKGEQYFFVFAVNEILKNDKGKYIYTSYHVPSSGGLEKDGTGLYRLYVTRQRDDYTFEVSDGLSQFAE